MPHGAVGAAVHAARPTGERARKHHRMGPVRPVPEAWVGWAEERHHRGADGGRKVHQARVARDDDRRGPQHGRRRTQSHATGRHGVPGRHQTLVFGRAHDHGPHAQAVERRRKTIPVVAWPPLGRVCGPGRERDKPSRRREGCPTGAVLRGRHHHWRAAVRRDPKVRDRPEILFRNGRNGSHGNPRPHPDSALHARLAPPMPGAAQQDPQDVGAE